MIRFGIVGTNFISDQFCDAVNKSGAAVCIAVYSRAQATGLSFAQKHGVEHVYTDYEQMLQSDIDAVYIASPHVCHCEQSLAAIRAGKHVLVEKAAALNRAQFSRMEEAARTAGVVLLEAMRPVFDPALSLLRASLPQLGTLRHASFSFCQYSSRYDRFLAGERMNAFDPTLCNAAVMDIGVYCAAMAAALFGTPDAVAAGCVRLLNGFEGSGCAVLRYGEMTCTLTYAKTFQADNRCEIFGERGTLLFDAPSKPRNLRLSLRGEEIREIPFVPAENNMVFEVQAFCRMIEEGADASPYQRLTAQTLEILDAVRRQNGIRFAADEESAM